MLGSYENLEFRKGAIRPMVNNIRIAINAYSPHTTVGNSKARKERAGDDTFHNFYDPNRLKIKDCI
jgi:hypothetical protein